MINSILGFTHIRSALPLFALLLLFLSSLSANACLNDRDTDTLTEEAGRLPGMVEVITGRFERDPPLYYEMRIQRVTTELKADPSQLPLYDDIAVAYDRISKDDNALLWMTQKRKLLGHTTPNDSPALHEAWYRYYANTGTFRVHRWLRAGADRKRIAEVKQARAEIQRAIEIKPDAHFGREIYQQMAMDWIIAGGREEKDGEPVELGRFIEHQCIYHPLQGMTYHEQKKKVMQGLAGLIVLGNAWESVDTFMALGHFISGGKLAYLAELRTEELIASRHRSLMPDVDPNIRYEGKPEPTGVERLRMRVYVSIHPRIEGADRVQKKYHELRAEAEAWQKARADYTMVRLRAGKHPDTDPTFWKDWHPKPAPSLSTGFWPDLIDKVMTTGFMMSVIFFYFPGSLIAFVVIRHIVRWHQKVRNLAF